MSAKVFIKIVIATAILVIVLITYLETAKQSETIPEYEPVDEIPTVIVRIVDDNRVIHSREGMLLDGVVTVELSGK